MGQHKVCNYAFVPKLPAQSLSLYKANVHAAKAALLLSDSDSRDEVILYELSHAVKFFAEAGNTKLEFASDEPLGMKSRASDESLSLRLDLSLIHI